MKAGSRSRGKAAQVGQLTLLEAPTPRRKRKVKLGRPKKPGAGAPHLVRPGLSKHHPVHVVLRVVKDVGTLRRRLAFQAIRNATIAVVEREDFRIVHLSLQRTHIHLLVEASDRMALARGMQSFQISAAKQLNRMISKGRPGPRRRGTVFPDRYHAEVIKSPLQTRRALSYVLNNWRKHHEDRDRESRRWDFDWFSSAWQFAGWTERRDAHFLPKTPLTYEPLVVRRPSTWLLAEGWQRHGLISYREVPSAK